MKLPKPLLHQLVNMVKPKVANVDVLVTDLQNTEQTQHTDTFVFVIDSGNIIGATINESGVMSQVLLNSEAKMKLMKVSELLLKLLNLSDNE